MFNIDFDIVIRRLLPNQHKRPLMLSWLRVLMRPLILLYLQFLGFREETIRAVSITPQTYSLEYYLNFLFNPNFEPVFTNNVIDYSNGGIWIENNPNQEPVQYVFGGLEGQDTVIVYAASGGDQTYIYSYQDYIDTIGFIIHVPNSLPVNEEYLAAIVRKYKIAGTRFEITYY